MFVIRPLRKADFNNLYKFATHARGMTSLPKDEIALSKLIELSLTSFEYTYASSKFDYYGFTLYCQSTNTVCGVSAIRAASGSYFPIPVYRVTKDYLVPSYIYDGPSELCSLFIHADYRKEGLGKLLSLARLHFVSTYPARFKTSLMAELRGFINEEKKSPFWENLGHKKCGVSYEEAEFLLGVGAQEVESFFSKEQIPLFSLSMEARAAIGKTHPNTTGAFKMLSQEGFKWTGNIDIIDGGPHVECAIVNSRTLSEIEILPVTHIRSSFLSDENWLISNNRLDFRAILSQVERNKQGIEISQEALDSLNIKIGDSIRLSRLHHDK